MDSAGRLEILRGPFSVLYGNAAGGVVQMWTAPGTPEPVTTLGFDAGSHGLARMAIDTRGTAGRLDYNVAGSLLRSDGARPHSRVRRESDNARLGLDLGRGRTLTLVANRLNQPLAEDPLGLTAAQVQADRHGVAPAALQFNTRKRIVQNQLGSVLDLPAGTTTHARLMAYAGQRGITQFQSIPVSAQVNPLSPGGVVVLDTGYGGMDARVTHDGQWAGRTFEFVAGVSADAQRQHRRGYTNFIGNTLGVQGALRRDEDDDVDSLDTYGQVYWDVATHWSLLLGARHAALRFRTRDRYVTASNPDDGGRVRYDATTPVAGITYRPRDTLRLYASHGRGFETPSFNELGYRVDGQAGLAFQLRPALSHNTELGAKWAPRPALQVEGAAFRADTRDELAVATNQDGRSTYRNVGRARRQGFELSVAGSIGRGWQLQAGMTWLDARFRTPFLACNGTPCTTPSAPVRAGTRLPGVPGRYGSLRLQHGGDIGWRQGLELSGVGGVTANDIGDVRAPGYVLLGVDAGYTRALHGHRRLQLTLRVDNLMDRDHIGSVIVNDGNGRYFEPGPGRSVVIGARVAY